MESLLDAFSSSLEPPPACAPAPTHVLVCGAVLTGKTALSERLVSDSFNGAYVKTSDSDHLWRTIQIGNASVALHVEDTPGLPLDADEHDVAEALPGPVLFSMCSTHGTVIPSAQPQLQCMLEEANVRASCPCAVVVAFTPNNSASLGLAKLILAHVYKLFVESDCECAGTHLPVILVATMTDLPRKLRKKGCFPDAAKLAADYNIPLIEASARTGRAVGPVFEAAARRALASRMCALGCSEQSSEREGRAWHDVRGFLPDWLLGETAGAAPEEAEHVQECLLPDQDILVNTCDMEYDEEDEEEDSWWAPGMSRCETTASGGNSSTLGVRRMCKELAKKKSNPEAASQVLDWRVARAQRNHRRSLPRHRCGSIPLVTSRSVKGFMQDINASLTAGVPDKLGVVRGFEDFFGAIIARDPPVVKKPAQDRERRPSPKVQEEQLLPHVASLVAAQPENKEEDEDCSKQY